VSSERKESPLRLLALKQTSDPGIESDKKKEKHFRAVFPNPFSRLQPSHARRHLNPISPPVTLNLKRPLAPAARSGLFHFNQQKEKTPNDGPPSFETKKPSGPTGPTSAVGKETVSKNALIHGLSGRTHACLPGGDASTAVIIDDQAKAFPYSASKRLQAFSAWGSL
jgi:hypothetical protein